MNYQNELYHFGIKGQKWGIRRYQNLDGTLTEAGKKHYASGSEQKKLGRLASEGDSSALRSTPQVKHAVRQMKDSVEKIKNARKEYDKIESEYYKDTKRVNSDIDFQREKLLDYYQGIGKKAPMEVANAKTFRELSLNGQAEKKYHVDPIFKSFMRRATIDVGRRDNLSKRYLAANEQYNKARTELLGNARKYADAFLGDYGRTNFKYASSYGKRYSAESGIINAIISSLNVPMTDWRNLHK